MTIERIEDFREIILPFVKKRLLEINYENLGESDAEEFAKDFDEILNLAIEALEQEPKTGHCKDCKWWKDSDGKYRRGCGAESQCPINTHTVYCGEGYCYMFEHRKVRDRHK